MARGASDGHTASCRSRGICGPSACVAAAASSLGKSDLFTLLIREYPGNLSGIPLFLKNFYEEGIFDSSASQRRVPGDMPSANRAASIMLRQRYRRAG